MLVHLIKLPTVPELLVRSSLSTKLFFYATRELSDWIFCSKNSKHGAGFREGGGHLTPQLDQLANLSSGVGLSLTSWGVAPSSTWRRTGTMYNLACIAGAIEQKDIFSWSLVSRMLQFKGLGIAIRNSWKVGGIGGQSDKMIDNDDHQTRWSAMMIKMIDNVSNNKTSPQVESGLLPAGAPALRSAEWNIALQSSTPARI